MILHGRNRVTFGLEEDPSKGRWARGGNWELGAQGGARAGIYMVGKLRPRQD